MRCGGDIPYTFYPFTSKTSRLVDSTRLTPPFSPPGRAMAKPTGADVTFRRSSFYFVQCGGLERRAAKPEPATSTTPRVASELLFNDGPEARADCTAALSV